MRRAALAIVIAGALACGAHVATPATSPMDRVEAAYQRLDIAAAAVLPRLPQPTATRAQAYLDALGAAVRLARSASTSGARDLAISDAAALLVQLGRVLR